MKIFKYEYDLEWGSGQGIVIAEDYGDALQMLSYLKKEVTLDEIDMTKKDVIDFSWEE